MLWAPSIRRRSGARGAWTVALLGAAAIAVVVLYRVNPATSDAYPRCPLLFLTGLYCPGCGSLRALHQLLHGDVRAALGYNALLVAAVPSLATMVAVPKLSYSPLFGRVVLFIVVSFGIARNIPAWPFTLLQP